MKIRLAPETLSDGSEVFNVVLSDAAEFIILHAIDENDAAELVRKISNAVVVHTVDEVTLV